MLISLLATSIGVNLCQNYFEVFLAKSLPTEVMSLSNWLLNTSTIGIYSDRRYVAHMLSIGSSTRYLRTDTVNFSQSLYTNSIDK